ncbi:uncharacterized protein LOC125543213 [Triticum urartu]|uniref:uncharacterized protein LOC125543213 n=1 Tax=Triticum urartu TaxID=4572 RepID=UPI002042DE2D|nr:uncharacterized protein LOC125543213 [Triticum urartu]
MDSATPHRRGGGPPVGGRLWIAHASVALPSGPESPPVAGSNYFANREAIKRQGRAWPMRDRAPSCSYEFPLPVGCLLDLNLMDVSTKKLCMQVVWHVYLATRTYHGWKMKLLPTRNLYYIYIARPMCYANQVSRTELVLFVELVPRHLTNLDEGNVHALKLLQEVLDIFLDVLVQLVLPHK